MEMDSLFKPAPSGQSRNCYFPHFLDYRKSNMKSGKSNIKSNPLETETLTFLWNAAPVWLELHRVPLKKGNRALRSNVFVQVQG